MKKDLESVDDFIRKTFENKLLHKSFDHIVKGYNDDEMTVEHFISSEKQDYIGDILKSDGMVLKGKPVVLLQHGRGFMGGEPIAKPLWIRKGKKGKENGIEANTKFFDDEQGVGKRLYQKTKEKYMPNWSVGFKAIHGKIKDNPNGRFIFEKWLLMEYSLVGIGENPDAKTKEMDDGITELNVLYIPDTINFEKFPALETGHFHKDYIVTTDKEKTAQELQYLIKDIEGKDKSPSFFVEKDLGDEKETKEEPAQDKEEIVQTAIEGKIEKALSELTKKMESFQQAVDDTFEILNKKIEALGQNQKQLNEKTNKIIIKNVPIKKQKSITEDKEKIMEMVRKSSDTLHNEMIDEFKRKILGKVD
jgi:hypothetical protein